MKNTRPCARVSSYVCECILVSFNLPSNAMHTIWMNELERITIIMLAWSVLLSNKGFYCDPHTHTSTHTPEEVNARALTLKCIFIKQHHTCDGLAKPKQTMNEKLWSCFVVVDVLICFAVAHAEWASARARTLLRPNTGSKRECEWGIFCDDTDGVCALKFHRLAQVSSKDIKRLT